MSGRPAPKLCPWCGLPTTAITGVCPNCVGIEKNLRREVTDSDALPPGRWTFDATRGIQVYVEHPMPTYVWCGTDSGYYRHRHRHEVTCRPCRTAHAEVEAARQRQGVAS